MFRSACSRLNIVLLACGCSGQAAQLPAKSQDAMPATAAAQPMGDPVALLAAVPAPPPTSRLPPSPPAQPSESPGYAETMARLRPAAAAQSLQALVAAPADVQAYAHATLAYATTDVPAMALIWGMTHQALGGGKDDATVAVALAKVLNERIVVTRDPDTQRADYNLRLAPGQMPARQEADGSVHAPLAHVFESMFGTTVMGYRPPWTIEQFYDAISSWVGLASTQGTPLDETLELNAWLVTTAKSGHLEAYCHQLLGPAFALELKAYKAANASAFGAYKDYLKGNTIKPTRAALPDDLVRVK
jgi:hypothetical protein